MAKRKLSPEQRQTIRKEIRRFVAQKKKPADILNVVSKKYSISTMTARWYLKSVRDPQPSSATVAGSTQGSKSASAKKTRKYTAKRNGQAQHQGAIHRLVANVQAIAEETFSRGREAKKLIPQWRAYVSKQLSLKKLESRVRRELRAVSNKAQALHRRLRELTSR